MIGSRGPPPISAAVSRGRPAGGGPTVQPLDAAAVTWAADRRVFSDTRAWRPDMRARPRPRWILLCTQGTAEKRFHQLLLIQWGMSSSLVGAQDRAVAYGTDATFMQGKFGFLSQLI